MCYFLTMSGIVTFNIVDVSVILPLRADVLRKGLTKEDARFDLDQDSSTLHVCVKIDDEVIACASLMAICNDNFEDKKQYQLRGVAVKEEYQKNGYGKALMQYCDFLALNRNVSLIWCNSRVNAVDFYLKCGYLSTNKEFFINNVGKHCLVYHVPKYHQCSHCKQ